MGIHSPWAIMMQLYEVFTFRPCCTTHIRGPRSSSTPNINGNTLRRQIWALDEGSETTKKGETIENLRICVRLFVQTPILGSIYELIYRFYAKELCHAIFVGYNVDVKPGQCIDAVNSARCEKHTNKRRAYSNSSFHIYLYKQGAHARRILRFSIVLHLAVRYV